MLPTDFNLTVEIDPLSSLYFAAAIIVAGVILIGSVKLILR